MERQLREMKGVENNFLKITDFQYMLNSIIDSKSKIKAFLKNFPRTSIGVDSQAVVHPTKVSIPEAKLKWRIAALKDPESFLQHVIVVRKYQSFR